MLLANANISAKGLLGVSVRAFRLKDAPTEGSPDRRKREVTEVEADTTVQTSQETDPAEVDSAVEAATDPDVTSAGPAECKPTKERRN